MKKRIAVHVFYDLILPLQKGKAGNLERQLSNKEIEEIFKNSKYYPEFDLGDMYSGDGYFIATDWQAKNDKIAFKGNDGKAYSVPKRWVIFESEHSLPFEMWDQVDRKQNKEE